jgi:hypothetical protein
MRPQIAGADPAQLFDSIADVHGAAKPKLGFTPANKMLSQSGLIRSARRTNRMLRPAGGARGPITLLYFSVLDLGKPFLTALVCGWFGLS